MIQLRNNRGLNREVALQTNRKGIVLRATSETKFARLGNELNLM